MVPMEIITSFRPWQTYMKCDLRPNDIFCNQLLLRHSCTITLNFIEHTVRCSSFLLTAFSDPMRNIDETQIKKTLFCDLFVAHELACGSVYFSSFLNYSMSNVTFSQPFICYFAYHSIFYIFTFGIIVVIKFYAYLRI